MEEPNTINGISTIGSETLVKLIPTKIWAFYGTITCVGLVIKIDDLSYGIHIVHNEKGHFNDLKNNNIYWILKGTNLLNKIKDLINRKNIKNTNIRIEFYVSPMIDGKLHHPTRALIDIFKKWFSDLCVFTYRTIKKSGTKLVKGVDIFRSRISKERLAKLRDECLSNKQLKHLQIQEYKAFPYRPFRFFINIFLH